ncbi:MAG: hypothetical protein QM758_13565 [Armatimonas sp.]
MIIPVIITDVCWLLPHGDVLESSYAKLSSYECLVTRENSLHGMHEKSLVRYRRDGKLLIHPYGSERASASFEGALLSESPLARLLQKKSLQLDAFELDGEEQLRGVSTKRYRARRANVEMLFWISTHDGLLRRFSLLGPGGIPTVTESYTAVRINPILPDSLFVLPTSHPESPAVKLPGFAARTGAERVELGRLSPVDNPEAARELLFVNRTGAPLKNLRVQGSCGCISTLVSEKGEKGDLILEPGQSTLIRVVIRLVGLVPGLLQKSVSVYAEGYPEPIARYDLTGQVIPSIVFEPAVLSFSPNSPKEQWLQVTLDERLVSGSRLPEFEGAQELLELTPQTPLEGVSQARDGVRVRRFSYLARLKQGGAIGSKVGRLVFKPAEGPLAVLWKTAGVSVIAQVAGAVSAMPQAVAFGAVTVTRDVEQNVALSYLPGAREARVASVDSPYLKVEVEPDKQRGDRENLRVRLLATCPNGSFQSYIRVQLKNGQVLTIPVTAFLQRRAGDKPK